MRSLREELIAQVRQQAELHLKFNLQDCRSRRNERNKWLFKMGMQQGIVSGLDFALTNIRRIDKDTRPMGQILLEHQQTVIETCLIMPHKAVQQWGLTELEDKLDIEKEDVICGVQHGLHTVAHTLPRLLKTKRSLLRNTRR